MLFGENLDGYVKILKSSVNPVDIPLEWRWNRAHRLDGEGSDSAVVGRQNGGPGSQSGNPDL
jgi:hypothetical protein